VGDDLRAGDAAQRASSGNYYRHHLFEERSHFAAGIPAESSGVRSTVSCSSPTSIVSRGQTLRSRAIRWRLLMSIWPTAWLNRAGGKLWAIGGRWD